MDELKVAVEKAVHKIKIPSENNRLEMMLQNLIYYKKEMQRIAIPSMEELQYVEIGNIQCL